MENDQLHKPWGEDKLASHCRAKMARCSCSQPPLKLRHSHVTQSWLIRHSHHRWIKTWAYREAGAMENPYCWQWQQWYPCSQAAGGIQNELVAVGQSPTSIPRVAATGPQLTWFCGTFFNFDTDSLVVLSFGSFSDFGSLAFPEFLWILPHNLNNNLRVCLGAQSVECLTFDFGIGHDLRATR